MSFNFCANSSTALITAKMNGAILQLNEHGIIEFVDETATNLLGFSFHELCNKTTHFYSLLLSPFKEMRLLDISNASSNNNNKAATNFAADLIEVETKSGEPLLCRCSIVRMEQGSSFLVILQKVFFCTNSIF